MSNRTTSATGPQPRPLARRSIWAALARHGVGPLAGLLAAATAIGVGEAAAAFVRPAASPIIVVGNRFILLTPESLRRWAIREFGSNDKSVLLTGIYCTIAVLALVLGALAVRRFAFGAAGLVLFGAVGVYSALTSHGHRGSDVVPTVIATLAGGYVLKLLCALIGSMDPAAQSPSGVLGTDRRRFLKASTAVAGVAILTGFGGKALQRTRYNVAAARAKISLPAPASPAAALAADTDLGKSGQPFVTPNATFYRVDTALSLPQIDPANWSLRIHGMVDDEITLTYQQILAMPLIERWITMTCVSNEVGGDLVGNARFLGARLADVLKRAGVHSGADQLVMSSSDGMTIGAPVAAATDGRDAMLAVGMNGDPLPVAHGFPVRVVIPGLYGYVSACKWITDLEVTTFAAYDAYWVRQGYLQQAPITLSSRIDRPRSGNSVPVGGQVAIAGVAWEQHVGVSKVEISVDGGGWMPARLASVPSIDTWRQWVLPWTPTGPGAHSIRVRAWDADGNLQVGTSAQPYPGAASGWHTITVTAR
ncbi:MAG TPA: molybdopterin-dependent oxidoreductase [Jatrophihabitantaceae bacterium]|nr:molybdopterin-dependent oxidoreductase [Jatrophihabitantaceae bacterium]